MFIIWKCVFLHIAVIWSSKWGNWSNITPKFLTFDDCVIILSPTLTDKPLKSHFSCGDLNTIKSVFESLIYNLFVIIHLLISARQLFNFEIASNGCLHLNKTYNWVSCCCCLPTPMTLASGGSPMFPLVIHQPASPSIWPAV